MPVVLPGGDAPALVEASTDRVLTHTALAGEVEALGDELSRPEKGLVFAFVRSDIASVVLVLAALRAGHAVVLLDAGLAEDAARALVERYRPDLVWHAGEAPVTAGYALLRPGLWVSAGLAGPVHEDLALLLTTSGSTGSPKLVRLSARNVATNVAAVIPSLGLRPDDRAITLLPIHYVYGFSVLATHLQVGASVVLSSASVLEPAFWEALEVHGCTSLSGVPYTFKMLDRVGFLDRELPALRAVTQAGGKLADDAVLRYHEALGARGCRFYVMYGQTEAAPRMTCLPPDRLPEKLGSVGVALEGGTIRIEQDGRPVGAEEVGEVVYAGPNVMMGYAEERADLALGDACRGVLRTGDLGRLDAEGFLYITGRTKRIGKVFGVRISLDEVEAMLQVHGPTAVVEGSDGLVAHCEWGDEAAHGQVRRELARRLRMPLKALRLEQVERLPTLPSGKVDYAALGPWGARR